MFKPKHKVVSSLYGNENTQSSIMSEHLNRRQSNELETASGEQIKCGRCKNLGDNRKKCKVRGM